MYVAGMKAMAMHYTFSHTSICHLALRTGTNLTLLIIFKILNDIKRGIEEYRLCNIIINGKFTKCKMTSLNQSSSITHL